MKLAREPEVLVLLEEEVVVRTRRFRRENPEMFDFAEATPTSSQQSRCSNVASDASQWSYSQLSVSEVLPLDELIQGMLKQRWSLTEFLAVPALRARRGPGDRVGNLELVK